MTFVRSLAARLTFALGVLALACGGLTERGENAEGSNAGAASTGGTASQPGSGTGGVILEPPPDFCDGVSVSTCRPGDEVCHPSLGRLTKCGPCGVPDKEANGPDCVRELATDKESGFACALRGTTELFCWNIAVPESLHWAFEAPEDTVSVALPDDASTAFLNGFSGCFLRADGSVKCPTFPAPGAFECAQVVVMDQPAPHVCVLCQGKVRCAGFAEQEIPPGVVDEIAGVDGELFSRNGSLLSRGFHEGETDLGSGTLTIDVFQEGTPCALHEDGSLGCENYGDIESDLVTLSVAEPPFACGLDSLGRASCFHLETGERTWMNVATNLEVSASYGGVCVRSAAGEVSCFSYLGEPRALPAGL